MSVLVAFYLVAVAYMTIEYHNWRKPGVWLKVAGLVPVAIVGLIIYTTLLLLAVVLKSNKITIQCEKLESIMNDLERRLKPHA